MTGFYMKHNTELKYLQVFLCLQHESPVRGHTEINILIRKHTEYRLLRLTFTGGGRKSQEILRPLLPEKILYLY